MKIPLTELPAIQARHLAGESYTALAQAYGVTPWAIQKRLRHYQKGTLRLPPKSIKSLRQRDWRAKKQVT